MKRDIVHDIIRLFLTVAVTAGFFGCLAALIFKEVPAANRDVLLTMTGSLGTAWAGCIVAWAFGSSAQSATKDATISQLARPS